MEIISWNGHQFNNNTGEIEPASDPLQIEALSRRLADELKTVKRVYLEGGEVLLPSNLTRNIAKDIFTLADSELCGLKGCRILISFENQRLALIDCDPSTPSTFELYLILKQNPNGWDQFLPQFLKKMTRRGAVMVSSEYEIQKRRLYRSYDD